MVFLFEFPPAGLAVLLLALLNTDIWPKQLRCCEVHPLGLLRLQANGIVRAERMLDLTVALLS